MSAWVPDEVCRKLGGRIANDVLDGYADKKHGYTIRQIANMLENDELVPVQHGRWTDEDYCSVCGQYVYPGDMRNYCPCCGAKMEAGE